MRRSLRILLSAAVAYLLAAVMMFFFQDRIIFPGQSLTPLPEAGRGVPGLERWWIAHEQGRSEAWFLPAPKASAERPAGLVLFAHGNNELIDPWPASMSHYRSLGFHVLLPEYRGYGRSEGSPSEEAIVGDLRQALELALARPEVDARRLVFHGRSIGTGVVSSLARVIKPRAVILQSPFVSIEEMAHRFLMPGFLVRSPFRSLENLGALDLPVLIFHGDADRVVPTEHGRRLHAALPGSRFVSQACGHADCPPDMLRHFEQIADFLYEAGLWYKTSATLSP